ncbi:procathepsin L-like isoform X2 [Phyllobates terribilis]|uniref:procathepsin L-like isoform X2 n=1 Tax=Phyllobates terribilis TaxID=111132 RepID=UPI003CCB4EB4
MSIYPTAIRSGRAVYFRMQAEKFLLVLCAAIVCVFSSEFLDQEWKAWKAKHDKEYINFRDEIFRRKAWEATWQKVQKHNQLADQGKSKYRMAMNKFADMTPEEWTSRKCFLSNQKSQNYVPVQDYSRNLNIPDAFDWRDSKCVNHVKNQGLCGSCWAFATVGVFETLHCIKTKKLVEFSEQQLVDCDNGDSGCCGGLPEIAMAYITSHGIMQSKEYEYLEKQDKCLYKPDNAVDFNVTKYYLLPGEDNMALSLVFNGPIAVGIDASHDFMLYCNGIFEGGCSEYPNHAVIIVGYGTEHDNQSNEDIDYWIVRNSWGADWGDEGYVKMRRNVNVCGIASHASSVDL